MVHIYVFLVGEMGVLGGSIQPVSAQRSNESFLAFIIACVSKMENTLRPIS